MPILQPLENMERISRQALADDLDTVLERISREDIGLVITEEGKDDLVLCPASWFNLDYVDDFSCVINSALRYAMRSEDEESAAVVQYLRRHYQLFDEKDAFGGCRRSGAGTEPADSDPQAAAGLEGAPGAVPAATGRVAEGIFGRRGNAPWMKSNMSSWKSK